MFAKPPPTGEPLTQNRCPSSWTVNWSRPYLQRRQGRYGRLLGDRIDPMVVIRWKELYDAMETVVDACESVAKCLKPRASDPSTPLH